MANGIAIGSADYQAFDVLDLGYCEKRKLKRDCLPTDYHSFRPNDGKSRTASNKEYTIQTSNSSRPQV